MHDGRFTSLAQVVEFYNSQVQPNPNLDNRLRGQGGAPLRLNLTVGDKAALVAFLGTLTDSTMLTASKFSNPFVK
jgi:cytochrome c peroxidase